MTRREKQRKVQEQLKRLKELVPEGPPFVNGSDHKKQTIFQTAVQILTQTSPINHEVANTVK